jgi:hypothetical protein
MARMVSMALAVFLFGCSTGSIGVRRNGSPACGVSTTGLMRKTVSVDAGVATFSGLLDRKVARLDSDGSIYKMGVWDSHAGSCRGGRLVIKGFFSDTRSEPIDGSSVLLPGVFSPTRYEYTAACSRCEAALGAYSLYALDQEAQAQQQQQQQQQYQYQPASAGLRRP